MRPLTAIAMLALFSAFSAYICAENDPPPLPDVDEVYPLPFDWQGFRILHIGDSHVSAGLKRGLQWRFDRAGASYFPSAWVGSRSKSWVVSGRLRKLLDTISPHVVIVTLETNAMAVKKPDTYVHWIHSVVRSVGPRRCYWLGPPPLVEDHFGFVDVLAESCGSCLFFDTRSMDFQKREDGKFHLTMEQGEKWAEKVWLWMNQPQNRPRERNKSDAV